jgi:hypothetical protein
VVYFSNPITPTKTVIQIDDVIWGVSKGFQTTEIKTYDISTGLAETDYQPTLIGDGVLGTEEDSVQILKEGLKFPTGVSDKFVANTIGKEILNQTGWAFSATLDPVNTTFANGDFDYISDFPLDPSNPVKFSQYGNILEAVITTEADSNGNRQTYTHDAILSP